MAPITLFLLFLAEAQASNYWMVLIGAVLLVIGRLLHGIAFSFTARWVIGRVGGMIVTFSALIILAINNLAMMFF